MRRFVIRPSSFFGSISFMFLLGAVLITAPQSMYAQIPDASLKVWDISTPIGSNPDPSVADLAGVTKHVATAQNPLTIATAIENSNHPGGPCGVIFWNPATNSFKDFGFGGGFQSGIDLNVGAPLKTTTFFNHASGATVTKFFGAGDAWMAKTGSDGIWMNFAGTNDFRSYGPCCGGGCMVFNGADCSGILNNIYTVTVDQGSGNIWYGQTGNNTAGLLDPGANTAKQWVFPGRFPHNSVVDSSGRAYYTLGPDRIARINPNTNEVLLWAVPSAGLLADPPDDQTPDGITLDASGQVWFTESVGNKVGRLNPATNQMCEFGKPGIADPQLIATSGAGDVEQAFFTEFGAGGGDKGGVTIVSQKDAVPTCATEVPDTMTLTPTPLTVPYTDFTETDGLAGCPEDTCRSPRVQTITPTDSTVPGVDPSGIIRYSFSSASPAIAGTAPSGMTGVALPNTVFGSISNFGSFSFTGHSVFQLSSTAVTAPACADDVTRKVTIVRGGFRKDLATGRFLQTVTVTNSSGALISGPIDFMVIGLSSNATLFNADGTTVCEAPLGSPFKRLTTSDLAAGASVSAVLQFTDPSNQAITYNARVLSGSGLR